MSCEQHNLEERIETLEHDYLRLHEHLMKMVSKQIERLEGFANLLPELAHKLHNAEQCGSIPQSQREMRLRRELLNRIWEVEKQGDRIKFAMSSIQDCIVDLQEDFNEFKAKNPQEGRSYTEAEIARAVEDELLACNLDLKHESRIMKRLRSRVGE